MMSLRHTAAVLAIIGFVMVPASRVAATVYCEIRQTADGFVALRAGPSVATGMLEKMRPGDEILLGPGRVGKWVEVVFWRGGRFASGLNPDGDPATAQGWMHENLIAEDSCG